LRLKKGGGRVLVTVHQKYFYWSIEGTVNKFFWSHTQKYVTQCNCYVFENLFFQCDLLCLYFVVFFSLNQMSILHELLGKIDTTSECRNGKENTLSITLGYIFLCMWSEEFIYRAFNWSVKILLINRDEDPPLPLFLTSKVEEWLMMTFVLENERYLIFMGKLLLHMLMFEWCQVVYFYG
jgi:hypothetical protein